MPWKAARLVILLATADSLNTADAAVDLPFGIPADLHKFMIPKDNPMTPEKIALGEMLFHDPRLSADSKVSCVTCNDAAKGFTGRLPTSQGIREQFGKRNAPTVLNAMFLDSRFLDGRAATLEERMEDAKVELDRQRKIAATNRPTRDTEAARGKKDQPSDVPPGEI